MPSKVARMPVDGKSTGCRIRQSKQTIRQSISDAMRKARSLLPTTKAAKHLEILTDVPLSTCEKVISGGRSPNPEILVGLLRSDLGQDVLIALMGDAKPAWFVRYRKQLDVNALRRQLEETKRLADALQQEASS